MTTSRSVAAQNNFDLLRFLLASTVFFYHSAVLSAEPSLAPLLRWMSADLAVKGFFVVSGFLVFMSFENSPSVGAYFGKRIRRVYPAYVAIVLVAAIGGSALSTLPLFGYISSGIFRYLAANLAFLNFLAPNLPGVFAGNQLTAVNGSLWTLKVEVMFYAIVPVLALAGARIGRGVVLLAMYAFAVAWVLAFSHLAAVTGSALYARLSYQLPGQLGYFAVGGICYYYLPRLRRAWGVVAVVALAGMILVRRFPAFTPVLEPAALGGLVLFFALGLRYLGNFGRYGDFSYGIYIIHFPILQTLIALGVFRVNPYFALVLAAFLVLAGAFISWHLVEKPFLRRSSHYVIATEVAGSG